MKKLEKVIETLIINGTLTEQLGLFYGKAGIAVFFFHYARHTGNELFQDYALDLIESIQEQITVTVSVRYDVGLPGIGVCMEYLLQNDFIESNDKDLFGDFDDRMYRAVQYEPYPDLSLQEGLTGWGRYFIYRLNGNGHKDSKLHIALKRIANIIARQIMEKSVSENEQPDVFRFFYDLTSLPLYAEGYADVLRHCIEWNCIREPDTKKIFPYMNRLHCLHVCQNCFNRDFAEDIRQEREKWEVTDNNSLTDIGLINGWATEGMLYLTFFQNLDNSWFNLL